MQHKGTVLLETERLILRQFRESDAEEMYRNWAGNPNVTRYLTWPTHSSPEESRYVIGVWMREYSDLRSYQWCIEYKENHQAIGSISVVEINENIDAAGVGYCIGEDYWHKGITAEALREVVRFLFEEVACNRIWARHDVHNPNSGKVMKKAGLSCEGTLKQGGRNNTGLCDMVIYGAVRNEIHKA